jgi:hypothetical protein
MESATREPRDKWGSAPEGASRSPCRSRWSGCQGRPRAAGVDAQVTRGEDGPHTSPLEPTRRLSGYASPSLSPSVPRAIRDIAPGRALVSRSHLRMAQRKHVRRHRAQLCRVELRAPVGRHRRGRRLRLRHPGFHVLDDEGVAAVAVRRTLRDTVRRWVRGSRAAGGRRPAARAACAPASRTPARRACAGSPRGRSPGRDVAADAWGRCSSAGPCVS